MKKIMFFLALCLPVLVFSSCSSDDKEGEPGGISATIKAVDLGLSVRWANCNVGARGVKDYGDYYAWGETKGYKDGKGNFTHGTYEHWKDGKYIDIGTDISGTDYDVAHVKMGGNWRMPTGAEVKELLDKCTWAWVINYLNSRVNGYLVTGSNGNQIFLPAAGARSETSLYNRDELGFYWSSTSDGTDKVNYLYLNKDKHIPFSDQEHYKGRTVRAVCPK